MSFKYKLCRICMWRFIGARLLLFGSLSLVVFFFCYLLGGRADNPKSSSSSLCWYFSVFIFNLAFVALVEAHEYIRLQICIKWIFTSHFNTVYNGDWIFVRKWIDNRMREFMQLQPPFVTPACLRGRRQIARAWLANKDNFYWVPAQNFSFVLSLALGH